MKTCAKVALLILGLTLACLLCGCPGMPGAPGGSGGAQSVPPGLQAPPGLATGGARTFMGTTITPPDDSFLLVKYTYARDVLAQRGRPAAPPQWQSCRRIIFLESCVTVEGLNYDGRAKGQEKDINQMLPYLELTGFYWKYEPKPAPPPQPKPKPGEKPSRTPR